MCLRPTEIEGSVARDDLASRLRFPNQILCVVTGKDDAEVFSNLGAQGEGSAELFFKISTGVGFHDVGTPYF